MQRPALVLLLLLGLAAAAYPTLGSSSAMPQVRAFTFEVTAVPCTYGDGVCLAYNGQVPGPTLDVNLGDTVQVTLVNHIARTLPPGAPASLATARVSWHVHGTAIAIESDGVGASSAGPNETFVYTARAAYAGTWHYHDHVIGFDGDEGAGRGLYGSLLVRTGAEPRPAAVLDLHMMDRGANGGRGLTANITAHERFELVVVGLENIVWTVTLKDPSNAIVGTRTIGPGISERIVVPDAQPGTYRWSASGLGTKSGTVIVS